jgi:hypothetical protein
MDRPTDASLLAHFAALEDPRQVAKVLYPLPEILLLLLSATLAGADDFVEIELWGNQQLPFPRRFLPYRHGIASHDTLSEVIAALDPALFQRCFTSWVEGLRAAAPDLVAIDGKTARRSHARSQGREPLHLVSALRRPRRRLLCRRIGRRPMGQPSAPGPRPGGGEWQVERDHRPPAAPGAPRAGGHSRHDRRHRQPERDRSDHPAPRWRPSPGAQGEPAGHVRGCRHLLRRPAGGARQLHDDRRRPRPDRDPPPCRRPRCRLAVLRPALSGRGRLPRPGHARPCQRC